MKAPIHATLLMSLMIGGCASSQSRNPATERPLPPESPPARDGICYAPAQEAAKDEYRKHASAPDTECSVEELRTLEAFHNYRVELQCGDADLIYHVTVKVRGNEADAGPCVATGAKVQAE